MELCVNLRVNRNVVSWNHETTSDIRYHLYIGFAANGKQRWSEARIAELERKVGQQALEIDFLKACWQSIEEQRMLPAGLVHDRPALGRRYHLHPPSPPG